jgi:hypothetical protein
MDMLTIKEINDRISNIDINENNNITKVISLVDILYNHKDYDVNEEVINFNFIKFIESRDSFIKEVNNKFPLSITEEFNLIRRFDLYQLIFSFIYKFSDKELLSIDNNSYIDEKINLDNIGYYINKEMKEYIFISRFYNKNKLSILISYDNCDYDKQIKNILNFDKELNLIDIEYKIQDT